MKQFQRRARQLMQRALRKFDYEIVPVENSMFLRLPGAGSRGVTEPPERLRELRASYEAFDCPASIPSYWTRERIDRLVDIDNFRGHTMYVWQYLDRPKVTDLKFFTYLTYIEQLKEYPRLSVIEESGVFGAPVFEFPGRPPVSRDSLDSVNEIAFLHRELGILDSPQLRVLDIGAGYGRLAHRMNQVVDGLSDYLCVDAIPESTFLCERYLSHQGDLPPARVVALPDTAEAVTSAAFDLALNIHSFSEMSHAAASYWIQLVAAAEITHFLIIPNKPTDILSLERDGRRLDLVPVLERHGYRLTSCEPVIADPAARALIGVNDHFHLFSLEE